jgi:hypothetical protein
MLKKLKNYFIVANIDEQIEFYYEEMDGLQFDIDYLKTEMKEVPSIIINQLTAYQNAVRRLRKIKKKYN